MRLRALRETFLPLLLVFSTAAAAGAQPADLVSNINTGQEDLVEPFFVGRDFAVLGTAVFFLHDDGSHGIELWKSDGTEAGTVLLKDVCPGACPGWPFTPTVSNGALYFTADDGVHGRELWRSDGTAAGTSLVTDLNPGFGDGAGPSSLFDLGGVLYLAADDGVHGNELWKTDGTAAGTVLVADLRPGPESSSPYLSLATGGKLLLNADDGVHGREPWVSDGTAAGTALLKDVNPGAADSSFAGPNVGFETGAQALSGGSFLFTADDGVHGVEPWISDGTGAGTVLLKDVNPGSNGSQAYGFTALGGSILFGAYDDTVSWELWATDGTEAGTHLVKDISSQFSGSSPRQLTPFGGRLFFVAYDGSNGRELWSTDGTEAGTVLVKDVNPGTANGFSPFIRTVIRATSGGLFFFADDGVHGNEIWTSDGTPAGTQLVKDAEPGSVSGVPLAYSGMTAVGPTVFFHGFTTAHGLELWKSDGTAAGTAEVKNIAVLASSLPVFSGFLNSTLGRIGGLLLFDAEDGISGLEPWVTDGTAATTQQIADLNPGSGWGGPTRLSPDAGLRSGVNGGEDLWKSDGTPAGTSPVLLLGTMRVESSLVPLGASWYFTGNDSAGGSELWKTDGTAAGTQRVKDIEPGSNGSNAGAITPFGSLLLFSAQAGSNGYELWKSDGTSAGTVLVEDLSTNPFGGSPAEITPLGSVALFTAYEDASYERDLWKTDGTPAGTVLLKTSASGLVRLGGTVLFLGTDAAAGREIWKTDGTAAGTGLLKDVRPGTGSGFSSPYFTEGNTQTVGGMFFFVANDGTSGAELWKTDGTTAGTGLVKDIYPGSRSSDIQWMTLVRGRLFFVAGDGVHGRELWVSDGSETGTRMVKDIVPGAGSPVIRFLKAMGRLVLFNATDGVNGVEPWQSDGTEAGTAMVQDIAPGAASSSPTGFLSAFPNVYFAANDDLSGFELWALPWAALGSTFTDVPVTHWAWRWVEALADAGLTRGCGDGQYCVSRSVTRAEVAAFLVRAIHGAGFTPPTPDTVRFQDVPASHWAFPWVEQFAADGLTLGCSASPPLFCPDSDTTRAQMSQFLLRALHGAAYTPPPATGTRFQDVPATYWAAAWIEQLAREGITSGCAPDLYCPDNPVGRDEMAAFLVKAFKLPLP